MTVCIPKAVLPRRQWEASHHRGRRRLTKIVQPVNVNVNKEIKLESPGAVPFPEMLQNIV